MSGKQILAVLGGVIVLSSMQAPLSSVGAEDPLPASAATAVPQNQQLSRNPQLPQHPLGAYTDAQYEAEIAGLRSSIARQYQDVLQKLGYVDPDTGQFIMGSVETEANRQKGLLNRSMGIAREDVTHQHQGLGTLFSGLRGTDQARAEFPYADQIGQLEVNTPLTLSQLYENAGGLVSDYTIGQNKLLAEAAARRGATAGTDGAVDPGATTAAPAAPGGTTYEGIAVPPMDDAFSPATGLAAANPGGSTYFGAPAGVDFSGTNFGNTPPAAPALQAYAGPPIPQGGVAGLTPQVVRPPVGAPSTAAPNPILTAAQRKLMQWG